MANFTKGEWRINKAGIAILADDKTIAVVGGPVSTEERIANARLMAKAPQMYEFIKSVHSHFTHNKHDLELMDLMIEAAKEILA